MMLINKTLQDFSHIDKESLVDIKTVKIDMELTKEQRIQSFLRQIKNPYICRYENIVVQSVFADTEITLDDRLKQYFRIESK